MGEIVYCPYIPVTIDHDEFVASQKRSRAGKTYAKVKLSHPSPTYRNKEGEVISINGNRYQLYIDVINTTTRDGMTTLIGVTKGGSGYRSIWFDKEDLAEIWKYDEKGDKII